MSRCKENLTCSERYYAINLYYISAKKETFLIPAQTALSRERFTIIPW